MYANNCNGDAGKVPGYMHPSNAINMNNGPPMNMASSNEASLMPPTSTMNMLPVNAMSMAGNNPGNVASGNTGMMQNSGMNIMHNNGMNMNVSANMQMPNGGVNMMPGSVMNVAPNNVNHSMNMGPNSMNMMPNHAMNMMPNNTMNMMPGSPMNMPPNNVNMVPNNAMNMMANGVPNMAANAAMSMASNGQMNMGPNAPMNMMPGNAMYMMPNNVGSLSNNAMSMMGSHSMNRPVKKCVSMTQYHAASMGSNIPANNHGPNAANVSPSAINFHSNNSACINSGINVVSKNALNQSSSSVMNVTPSVGTSVPSSNSMNIPGQTAANGMNSSSMSMTGHGGVNMPGINGMNVQCNSGMNMPNHNGMNTPSHNGMTLPNNNSVNMLNSNGMIMHNNSMNMSNTNGMIMPSNSGMNMPNTNGMNMTTNNGMNMINNNGMNIPSNSVMNMPSNNGMNMPSNNGMNMPSNNGMNMMSNNGMNMMSNNGLNMMTHNGMNMPNNNDISLSSNNGMNMLSNNGMNMPGNGGMNMSASGGVGLCHARMMCGPRLPGPMVGASGLGSMGCVGSLGDGSCSAYGGPVMSPPALRAPGAIAGTGCSPAGAPLMHCMDGRSMHYKSNGVMMSRDAYMDVCGANNCGQSNQHYCQQPMGYQHHMGHYAHHKTTPQQFMCHQQHMQHPNAFMCNSMITPARPQMNVSKAMYVNGGGNSLSQACMTSVANSSQQFNNYGSIGNKGVVCSSEKPGCGTEAQTASEESPRCDSACSSSSDNANVNRTSDVQLPHSDHPVATAIPRAAVQIGPAKRPTRDQPMKSDQEISPNQELASNYSMPSVSISSDSSNIKNSTSPQPALIGTRTNIDTDQLTARDDCSSGLSHSNFNGPRQACGIPGTGTATKPNMAVESSINSDNNAFLSLNSAQGNNGPTSSKLSSQNELKSSSSVWPSPSRSSSFEQRQPVNECEKVPQQKELPGISTPVPHSITPSPSIDADKPNFTNNYSSENETNKVGYDGASVDSGVDSSVRSGSSDSVQLMSGRSSTPNASHMMVESPNACKILSTSSQVNVVPSKECHVSFANTQSFSSSNPNLAGDEITPTAYSVAPTNNSLMHSTPSHPGALLVVVPFGWRRIISANRVVYVSPSGNELSSALAVSQYLTTEGTCKCGLQCPLKVASVFCFDPNVPDRPTLPAELNNKDVLQSCTHRRKLADAFTKHMTATRQQHLGLQSRPCHEAVCHYNHMSPAGPHTQLIPHAGYPPHATPPLHHQMSANSCLPHHHQLPQPAASHKQTDPCPKTEPGPASCDSSSDATLTQAIQPKTGGVTPTHTHSSSHGNSSAPPPGCSSSTVSPGSLRTSGALATIAKSPGVLSSTAVVTSSSTVTFPATASLSSSVLPAQSASGTASKTISISPSPTTASVFSSLPSKNPLKNSLAVASSSTGFTAIAGTSMCIAIKNTSSNSAISAAAPHLPKSNPSSLNVPVSKPANSSTIACSSIPNPVISEISIRNMGTNNSLSPKKFASCAADIVLSASQAYATSSSILVTSSPACSVSLVSSVAGTAPVVSCSASAAEPITAAGPARGPANAAARSVSLADNKKGNDAGFGSNDAVCPTISHQRQQQFMQMGHQKQMRMMMQPSPEPQMMMQPQEMIHHQAFPIQQQMMLQSPHFEQRGFAAQHQMQDPCRPGFMRGGMMQPMVPRGAMMRGPFPAPAGGYRMPMGPRMGSQWPPEDDKSGGIKRRRGGGAAISRARKRPKVADEGSPIVVPSFLEDPNAYLAQQTAMLNSTMAGGPGQFSPQGSVAFPRQTCPVELKSDGPVVNLSASGALGSPPSAMTQNCSTDLLNNSLQTISSKNSIPIPPSSTKPNNTLLPTSSCGSTTLGRSPSVPCTLPNGLLQLKSEGNVSLRNSETAKSSSISALPSMAESITITAICSSTPTPKMSSLPARPKSSSPRVSERGYLSVIPSRPESENSVKQEGNDSSVNQSDKKPKWALPESSSASSELRVPDLKSQCDLVSSGAGAHNSPPENVHHNRPDGNTQSSFTQNPGHKTFSKAETSQPNGEMAFTRSSARLETSGVSDDVTSTRKTFSPKATNIPDKSNEGVKACISFDSSHSTSDCKTQQWRSNVGSTGQASQALGTEMLAIRSRVLRASPTSNFDVDKDDTQDTDCGDDDASNDTTSDPDDGCSNSAEALSASSLATLKNQATKPNNHTSIDPDVLNTPLRGRLATRHSSFISNAHESDSSNKPLSPGPISSTCSQTPLEMVQNIVSSIPLPPVSHVCSSASSFPSDGVSCSLPSSASVTASTARHTPPFLPQAVGGSQQSTLATSLHHRIYDGVVRSGILVQQPTVAVSSSSVVVVSGPKHASHVASLSALQPVQPLVHLVNPFPSATPLIIQQTAGIGGLGSISAICSNAQILPTSCTAFVTTQQATPVSSGTRTPLPLSSSSPQLQVAHVVTTDGRLDSTGSPSGSSTVSTPHSTPPDPAPSPQPPRKRRRRRNSSSSQALPNILPTLIVNSRPQQQQLVVTGSQARFTSQASSAGTHQVITNVSAGSMIAASAPTAINVVQMVGPSMAGTLTAGTLQPPAILVGSSASPGVILPSDATFLSTDPNTCLTYPVQIVGVTASPAQQMVAVRSQGASTEGGKIVTCLSSPPAVSNNSGGVHLYAHNANQAVMSARSLGAPAAVLAPDYLTYQQHVFMQQPLVAKTSIAGLSPQGTVISAGQQHLLSSSSNCSDAGHSSVSISTQTLQNESENCDVSSTGDFQLCRVSCASSVSPNSPSHQSAEVTTTRLDEEPQRVSSTPHKPPSASDCLSSSATPPHQASGWW
ncbi:mucin-12 [Hyalella azteca]|uniref:Mucin-12 n=1 Tax=Hyalella azteca TaxID=294128 RepID=A0A8B7NSR3_HYAAZ|nr:mucin-12 [Hyalella azteca]